MLLKREREHARPPDVCVVVNVETDVDVVAVGEVTDERRGLDLDLGVDPCFGLLRLIVRRARVYVDLREQLRPDPPGGQGVQRAAPTEQNNFHRADARDANGVDGRGRHDLAEADLVGVVGLERPQRLSGGGVDRVEDAAPVAFVDDPI